MDRAQLLAQADAIVDQIKDKFLELMAMTDGWEDLGSVDGVKASQIFTENGTQLMRGSGIINHDAEIIMNMIYDGVSKQEWDEMLLESTDIINFTPTYKICYEKFHCPWPLADRDFVYACKTYEASDGLFCLAKSMEIAGIPSQEGIVRGEVINSGYYLRRLTPTSTEVTLMLSTDPKGSVPVALVRIVSKQQVSNINKIRNLLG